MRSAKFKTENGEISVPPQSHFLQRVGNDVWLMNCCISSEGCKVNCTIGEANAEMDSALNWTPGNIDEHRKTAIIAFSTGYEEGHQDTVDGAFSGNGRTEEHDEAAEFWLTDAENDGTFDRDLKCD